MVEKLDEASEELLTLDQAVEYLGISKATMYRLLDRGEVAGLKAGRQWRFRKTELDAYLNRGPVSRALGSMVGDALDAELAFLTDELHAAGTELPAADAQLPPDEGKVVQLVTGLLLLTIKSGASDLHLEPVNLGDDSYLNVRLRVDGVLREARRLPFSLYPAVLLRWKIMANLDLNERRLPQDGCIRITHQGREQMVLVTIVPGILGETLVGRLTSSSNLIGLDRLMGEAEALPRFRALLHRPHGLLLITGPSGSGKTTVLYNALLGIADSGKNLVSVEDPVTQAVPWMTQVQVNPAIGLTFGAAIRALLRQDPDILAIVDARDRETLLLATHAAMTGHLVLANASTENAVAAARWLVQMGVEPFLVTSSVIGITAQRLVRALCPHCKTPVTLPAPVRARVQQLAADGGFTVPDDAVFRQPNGCDACKQTGYRSRIALFEVLEITPAIKDALLNNATEPELTALAVRGGMRTLAADGLSHAVNGRTSVEEVLRVLGEM